MPFKPDIYCIGLIGCWMATKDLPDSVDIYNKDVEFPEGIYTKELIEFIYFCLVRHPD